MEIIIRSALIINPLSSFHLQKRDIFIKDGIIKQVSEHINASPDCLIIDEENLHVSAGWFDLKVNFRDPGFEQKEDISSGLDAAANGGFTGVLVMPSTNPPIQTKSGIEYLINKSKPKAVDLFVAGAVTVDRAGEALAEMYDMKQSGAIAFTDDKRTISDSGVMLRAMQYSTQINSLVIAFAEDKTISGKAEVNESVSNTRLGFKGAPAMAEELIIARDISLCEYSGARIHFSLVSCENSVNLIREAKKKGLHITADVSAYHLFLDDSRLENFNSNFKTKPPLRSKKDILALIRGLKDGTLDAIVSDHSPEDVENKVVEFDFAAFGIISLETAFSIAFMALHEVMTIAQIVEKFTYGRSLLGLRRIVIKENETANLTLFNPDKKWNYSLNSISSKSKNSPFINEMLAGKVIGIVNKGVFSKSGPSVK